MLYNALCIKTHESRVELVTVRPSHNGLLHTDRDAWYPCHVPIVVKLHHFSVPVD